MTLPNTSAVTATPRPDGVDLHVDGHTRTTLKHLIGILAERDDLLEEFLNLFEPPAETDPHATAVADRDEQFLNLVMPELPTTIRMNLQPARRLGAALGRITRRQARRQLASVPRQRDWRWTA
jgi:hypothetical protein